MKWLMTEDKSKKLLEINNLTKIFGHGSDAVKAVDNISFEIDRDEIVSFVGQSGSGKTTLARMILALTTPTSGEILYRGNNVINYKKKERIIYWRDVQGIFQDPYASFN